MSIHPDDLQQIERIMAAQAGRVMRFVSDAIQTSQENILSALDDATTAAATQVAALATEVANANAKTDAALAALAASVTSGQPATQAQIDAITAIGTSAAAATAALQVEEAKVTADLAPAASPAEAPAPAADGSAPAA